MTVTAVARSLALFALAGLMEISGDTGAVVAPGRMSRVAALECSPLHPPLTGPLAREHREAKEIVTERMCSAGRRVVFEE